MYSTTLKILLLATTLGTVYSESEFTSPPAAGADGDYQDNPSYTVGQKIDIQWTSNLTSMNLILWQEYPMASDSDYYYNELMSKSLHCLDDTRSTSYIWTVSLDGFSTDVATGESAVFYLAIQPAGSAEIDGTSHYFNVSVSDSSTTSATASQGDATKATTSSTATTSSSADSEDSGLSTGAIAGVAVGATLGGLLVLGGVGFLIWKQMKKRGSASAGGPTRNEQVPLNETKSPGQDYAWIQPPQGTPPPAQSPQGLYEAPEQSHRPIYEAP